MNEIFERLIQAAAKLDLQGNSNIARFLNESPQVVTNWSKRGVPARKIIEIAPLLGVSPEWLQTGKGAINNEAMRVINEQDETMLKLAKMMLPVATPHSNAHLQRIIEGLEQNQVSDTEKKELEVMLKVIAERFFPKGAL